MKRYVPNPNIHRDHFRQQLGHGLPGFRGSRMQYGHGIGAFLGKLARRALPLLVSAVKTGVKVAKPHAKTMLQGMAKDVIGKAAEKYMAPMPRQRPRRPKRLSRAPKRKQATSPDIF